jgi:hypothetical protein
MKKIVFGLLLLALSASPARAAGLKLVIGNGLVSIDAQDVTLRQILTEWARLGKTRIVNLEGITSGPITLKLDGVPENIALDIILRSLPGYMAAPRSGDVANVSLYDRILIMTTTTAVAGSRAGSFPGQGLQPPNAFPGGPNVTQLRPANGLPPGMVPGPIVDDQQDDPAIAAAAAAGLITVPALVPGMANPPMMGPNGPLMNPAAPPTSVAPTPTPSNPFNVPTGAARPGLATPAPQPQPPPPMPDTGLRRPPLADR